MQEADGSPAVSRRALLGGVAGLALGTRAVSARQAPALSVLTWNLYHGVSLWPLRDVSSAEELREVAGDLLSEVERHPTDARMDAIGRQIVRQRPDVLALQEAVQVRKRPAGEATDGSGSDAGSVSRDDGGVSSVPGSVSSDNPSAVEDGDQQAWTTVVDLLESVRSSLADEGGEYRVASSTVTTGTELIAATDDGDVELTVADRDVLLVRDGVATGDTRAGTYQVGLTYSLPNVDRSIRLARGYCLADVVVGGRPVTIATTHLERVSGVIRRLQASELRSLVPADGPVVVAGDFNSGPGGSTAAYDALTDRFADAWTTLGQGEAHTCCQHSSLRNGSSGLDRRVDAVLFDGPLRPTAATRLGADQGDRVEIEREDDTVTMWPSNHAGVVATFDADWSPATPTATPTAPPTATSTPTPAPTPSPSPSATPPGSTVAKPTSTNPARATAVETGSDSDRTGTDPDESSGAGPGFGVVTALAALGIGTFGRRVRDAMRSGPGAGEE